MLALPMTTLFIASEIVAHAVDRRRNRIEELQCSE
jgi:hypothetical protein